MSSPAVVSVAMNTYWPQDHGTKIFKYGTLPLVSIGTEQGCHKVLNDSSEALIFTPVTSLLLYGSIVSTTGKFSPNIKGPSSMLSRNSYYGLQPC